jgi:hypothetical protein
MNICRRLCLCYVAICCRLVVNVEPCAVTRHIAMYRPVDCGYTFADCRKIIFIIEDVWSRLWNRSAAQWIFILCTAQWFLYSVDVEGRRCLCLVACAVQLFCATTAAPLEELKGDWKREIRERERERVPSLKWPEESCSESALLAFSLSVWQQRIKQA